MTTRAETAAATGARILDAALALFSERFYDDVTLEEVARLAGVTTQTVIRRFGSKEGLLDAVGARARASVLEQRGQAPVGDVAGAVANLVEHYEEWGDGVLHLLAQENRVEPFRVVTDHGRKLHREWVRRTFAPQLAAAGPERRRRLASQLVAVCDVYTWKLLRRDLRLGREQTELALRELIDGLTRET